jgi:hypothetical protein
MIVGGYGWDRDMYGSWGIGMGWDGIGIGMGWDMDRDGYGS